MSYKEEIKIKLQEISSIEDENQLEKRSQEIIKELFTKALRESKKTGQSIESITYEFLEGLEEGFNALQQNRLQHLLHNASQTITEVIHRCAQENILHKNRHVKLAIEKLQDTIEAEKLHLLESMEAFKAYAHDHTHTLFAQKLHHLQDNLNQMLHTITDKLKEYEK